MFLLHFIVIGMGRPFLIGCTNKVIIIIIIIIIIYYYHHHHHHPRCVCHSVKSD